jgi:hypothetical protein
MLEAVTAPGELTTGSSRFRWAAVDCNNIPSTVTGPERCAYDAMLVQAPRRLGATFV